MKKKMLSCLFVLALGGLQRDRLLAQANPISVEQKIAATGSSVGRSSGKLEAFSLADVRLLQSPFLQAQATDLQYILSLDADRLLAPFLREAGLQPHAPGYGNWEGTGLDGHIGGHYLSALALMYAATGEEPLRLRLNYMLEQLERCQQRSSNGYVGGIPGGAKLWQEIAEGKIRSGSFSLNDKWVPLYNLHKLFAGLVDAWQVTGNEKARKILVGLSNWFWELSQKLSDEQWQTILRSEHGGLNEVFADVATITGEDRYLQLAKKVSHRSLLEPLLQQKDKLNGLHANTQIPKVIGYGRIAALTGDTAWKGAAEYFWNNVTRHRSVSIGGNSVREHFHPAQDFSSMIEDREGPETCNSYNMLKLSKQLFLSQPNRAYIDYYERTLYNHILSSQHPGGGFVYFTPIRPRHYRVYSEAQQSFWCCVGTGMENHGKYGELIYAYQGNDIYVNLFIPSVLRWKEKGITLTQQTRFPYEEGTRIQLDLPAARQFSLYFRYPSWVSRGKLQARVNNRLVPVDVAENGYAVIRRVWKKGDEISLSLPMETRAEFLPDSSQWVSFVRGPIVLAAATDTTGLQGLKGGDSRMGHIASGPLYPIEEAPMLVAPGRELASFLQPVKNKAFTYRAPALLYPEKYQSLELVPFYTIHDARYMLYWRYATPQQLAGIQEELRQKEKERRVLEAITIDQVAPGEQQPETDHQFRGERTETGTHKDRHWRSAKGWFSYVLKNPWGEAQKLRVRYYGKDRNRTFAIYINEQLLETVTLKGTEGDRFFDVDYLLPEGLKGEKNLVVKFMAVEGSTAGGVFGVRLLRP